MDWNNDGKQDLISGDTKGQVWLFLNEGTKEKPILAKGVRVEAAGKPISGGKTASIGGILRLLSSKKSTGGNHQLAKTYSWLHMGDWDGDDLKDLLVGHSATLLFYKNAGTPSEPRFLDPTLVQFAEGKSPRRPSAKILDWDGDDVRDMLLGTTSSDIFWYRNAGTNQEPRLEKGVKLDLRGDGYLPGYGYRLEATDWNNDGKRDLLVGTCYGKQVDGKRKTYGNVWLFLGE